MIEDAEAVAGSALNIVGPDRGVATLHIRGLLPANTMTQQTVTDLQRALRDLSARDDVRVLVLRGTNGTFSSGADLGWMADMDEVAYRSFVQAESELWDLAEGLPFVTIAAIEGACIGNAAELALACDLRIAADNTRFGFPETRIGFHGPVLRLSRFVGLGIATRLLFGGEILSADQAVTLGLITWGVPAAEFDEQVVRRALEFAELPKIALQETKANLAAAYPKRDRISHNEFQSALRTFRTADATEGRAAFLAKRRPVFRGV